MWRPDKYKNKNYIQPQRELGNSTSDVHQNHSLGTVPSRTDGELYRVQNVQKPADYSSNVKPNNVNVDKVATNESQTQAYNASGPTIVMLVGPGKTGTTYLQTRIPNEMISYLEKDNYSYKGRYDPMVKGRGKQQLRDYLVDKNCKSQVRCRGLLMELDRLYIQRKNVLVVEEFLDAARFNVPTFIDATRGRWNVIIVVSYRRFFEWLPSVKNQSEKRQGWPRAEKPSLNGTVSWSNAVSDRSRPTPMAKYLEVVLGRNTSSNIENILESYEQLSIGVTKILNTHDDEDLMSNFLCNIVPNAPNSCDYSRRSFAGVKSKGKVNPSVSLDYALIAVEAAEQGMLDRSKIARQAVVDKLRSYHSDTLELRPLPLECADQSLLDAFLEESLRIEKQVLPEFYQVLEQKHREMFWNATGSHKFCSVNTTAVLDEVDWQRFFEELMSSM